MSPKGRSGRTAEVLGLALLVLTATSSRLGAQPALEHAGVRCVPQNQFTQFLAEIQPPEDVRTAKLYFRSRLYPDYYYVEMASQGARFHAVIPLPAEETSQIVYYIEAIDYAFNTTRSQEYVVDVESGHCRPGPGAALYTGDAPGIVVGATQAGASSIPPGFQAAGIAGFISAAGSAAVISGGGGAGVGLAIGAAAGAAAGVGVVAAKNGDDDGGEPPGSATPAVTTSTSTTVSSGTTTSTSPGGTTTSSSPKATTSVASTTTSISTSTARALTACFTWTALGECKGRFESCSQPAASIVTYDWRMLGPPPILDLPSQSSFDFDFAPDPRCQGTMPFLRPIRLTVFDAQGNSASEQKNITVVPGSQTQRSARSVSLTAALGLLSSGSAEGAVMAGETTRTVTDRSPVEIFLRVPHRSEPIEVLARTRRAPPGTIWSFEVSPSDALDLGSLEVRQGELLERAPGRLVFRLQGSAGEVVRFRFLLKTPF